MAPRAERPSPDIAGVGEPGSRDRKREEVGAPSSEEAGHAQDESREGSWLGEHRCHPDRDMGRLGSALGHSGRRRRPSSEEQGRELRGRCKLRGHESQAAALSRTPGRG